MTGPDEYETVLGMPSGPRPPDHYHLLGLELFESIEGVIAAAADGRVVDAEASTHASADQIRQVVDKIRLAKACLLDEKSKADYDRQLNLSLPGIELEPIDGPIRIAGPSPVSDSSHVESHDEPQFEALPADLIAAGRPARKPRNRKWFWAFTFAEALFVVGLYFYLHRAEPMVMPSPPVGSRAAAEKTNAADSRSRPPIERPPQRVAEPIQPAPASVPLASRDPLTPNPPLPTSRPDDDRQPSSIAEPKVAPEAMTAIIPGGAALSEEVPHRSSPVERRPVWPNQWTLQFVGNLEGSIDNELLALNADELKTLAALREQPLYTVRDAITKKPIAALPFDNQGHLNGSVVALLSKNDWRACLSYVNQVLQGRSRIFDARRQCVYFADYRFKGRSRLLCLCADGVPVAVQIWRGKESVAYLIELAEGGPVVTEQKQLSAEKMERLGAALAELASIEGTIRDCEKDWKSQLADWWKLNDTALRAIAVKSMPDSEKQTRRNAYYKQLFDEQHAGLDKFLSQFESLSTDPASPKP